MTIHGFKEDFKEEEPVKEKEKEKDEKEKEKEKVVEDSFDQETKEKEKEREKEKAILLKMIVTMPMKNGKDMKMKIGMKAIGPMKMKQLGNPKAGMNGKSMMNTDISKEKEKERKVMDLQNKEKDKVMGKEKQTMWTHHILLNRQCSKQLYLRQRVPLVSLWHIQM